MKFLLLLWLISFQISVRGNYRSNTFTTTSSTLETVNSLVRELRKEVADIKKDMNTKLESVKYDINCEIKNLRDEIFKDPKVFEPGTLEPDFPIEEVPTMKRKLKKSLKNVADQSTAMKIELRSQKAELFALRNSVYDSREDVLDRSNNILRYLRDSNRTFICYMNDLRMHLYKINTNFAMIKRDQQRIKDLIKMAGRPGYMQRWPIEQPRPTEYYERKKILPGCTTNPLETQETLHTFRSGPIFSNFTHPKGGKDKDKDWEKDRVGDWDKTKYKDWEKDRGRGEGRDRERHKDWDSNKEWESSKPWDPNKYLDSNKDWDRNKDWDNNKDWDRNKDWDNKDWDRNKDWDSNKEWDRNKDLNTNKDWNINKDWETNKEWERNKDWNANKNWDVNKQWDPNKDWNSNIDWKRDKDKTKDRDWEKTRDKDWNKDIDKGKDWNRDRNRDKGRDKTRGRERGRDRDRSRNRGRGRGRGREHYPRGRAGSRGRSGISSLFNTPIEHCQDPKSKYLEYPPIPRDCSDVYDLGFMESGVYRIQPPGVVSQEVVCEHETNGGGWTVILIRQQTPIQITFNRTWEEYEDGFGDATREYWLGLKILNILTWQFPHEFRVEMEDWEGNVAWAEYSYFTVAGPADKYRLRISGYRGNAGDSMRHSHLQMFSTIDQDNDQEDWGNCARSRGGGGWWWGRCACTQPTGQFRITNRHIPEFSITWWHWKNINYALKKIVMMIRPREL